ncbi:MAG TPA: cell division protein FtsQ/DivIB [Candidatus Binataceae bacterium]|nr:cell division protein FtsQ/DivIB [Candidatus Binataceae bacterium]
MAVAAAKKKKRKTGSDWSWRLAGIALCAFFALGVIAGLSQSGRMLALRIEALLNRLPHTGRSELIPATYETFARPPAIERPAGTIALVEREDGFYELDSMGSLRGPVSLVGENDLPVLSGPGVESLGATQLLEIASQLIRGEATLSEMISEMHVKLDGSEELFLEWPRVEIELGAAQIATEIARAAQVLSLWRGRRELISQIDMTTPGEAVVRLKASIANHASGAEAETGGNASRTARIGAPRTRTAQMASR